MTTMFLLNHTWRTRFDKAAAFLTPSTFFLLRTLVVHPAILAVLFLLLMCRGNIGEGLLSGAEGLVRDAPAGQVWACERISLQGSVPSADETAEVECRRQVVSRSAWVEEANRSLVTFYKTAVLLSLMPLC
ncbi:hypothetical protein [Pantoea vagans]|uniref:hypothetical protein n=1 Tax=Pantoea vagans TaxID=470934 RepID=UPI00366B65A1